MESILRGFEVVPPNYRILLQLTQLMKRYDVDVEEISDLIRLDSALAASVMRLSNSAFYASSTPADSLNEAIYRLGFGEILKLVGLVSNLRFPQISLRCYNITPTQLTLQTLAIAILMELMSGSINEEPGLAYITGLMLPMGRYPIAIRMQKVKPMVTAVDNYDFMALACWERVELGTDHAQICSGLLQSWEFPETIYGPLGKYLYPMLGGEHKRMAALLHICSLMMPCVVNPRLDLVRLPLSERLIAFLGLTPEILEKAVGLARERLDHTRNAIRGQMSVAI
jgi:HD-like signal output (HDOD) protein